MDFGFAKKQGVEVFFFLRLFLFLVGSNVHKHQMNSVRLELCNGNKHLHAADIVLATENCNTMEMRLPYKLVRLLDPEASWQYSVSRLVEKWKTKLFVIYGALVKTCSWFICLWPTCLFLFGERGKEINSF